MSQAKLYLVMVGLPARGKSTVARKIKENLNKEGIKTRIFNNGDLRRQLYHRFTPPPFLLLRQQPGGGRDKTPAGRDQPQPRPVSIWPIRARWPSWTPPTFKRSAGDWIRRTLTDHPLLFLECVNTDEAILKASVQRKIQLSEFDQIDDVTATHYFNQRIKYYEARHTPVRATRNHVRLDTLNNRIP